MSTNSILNIFGYQTQPTTPEAKEMFLNLYNSIQASNINKFIFYKFDKMLEYTIQYKDFINNNFDELNFNSNSSLATSITSNNNPSEDLLAFAYMLQNIKTEGKDIILKRENSQFIFDNGLVELTTKVITNNNNIRIKKLWKKYSSNYDNCETLEQIEGRSFRLSIADIDEGDNKPVFFVNNSTKKCYSIDYSNKIYLVKKDDLKWYNNDIKLELIRKLDKEALCKEIENNALTKYIRPVILEELFEELSTHTKLEIVEEIAEYRDNIKSLNKKINKMPEELYEGTTKTLYFDIKTKITNILELELLKN